MGLVEFENQLWKKKKPVVLPSHVIASEMVSEEPILDIGGGSGTLALLLKQRGFNKITIVDISSVAVEKARAKGFKAQVLDVSKMPLPFKDLSFATVIATDVLEHLYDPVSVLKECGRIGKRIILSLPNFHYFKDRIEMLLGKVPFECRLQRGGHVFWFNYKILTDVLEKANLEIEKQVFITPSKFLPKSFWNGLAKVMPNLIPIGYVIKCKRKDSDA